MTGDKWSDLQIRQNQTKINALNKVQISHQRDKQLKDLYSLRDYLSFTVSSGWIKPQELSNVNSAMFTKYFGLGDRASLRHTCKDRGERTLQLYSSL